MAVTKNRESWFSRNDWIRPIAASVLLILAPLVASTLLNGNGIALPGWASILASVGACFGLLFGALKARLTDTLAARIFCYLIVAFGYAVAIWQIFEVLKH